MTRDAFLLASLLLVANGTNADQGSSSTDYDAAVSRGLHPAEDANYGFSEDQPVRIGSRQNRTLYLLSLRGPKGQNVRYERLGSCCHQDGGGVLDVFEIWHRQMAEPRKLFLDIYRYSEPRVPHDLAFEPAADDHWPQWAHSWLVTSRRWEWTPHHQTVQGGDEEYRQNKVEAWQVARAMPGFTELTKTFDIESVTLGEINLMPEALYAEVRTTGQRTLNSFRWWNPLDQGQPQRDWHDFLKMQRKAGEALSSHVWLQQWRETSPGRTLELHALGLGIGERERDLSLFLSPVWRDAKFKGEPTLSVVARRPRGGWANIYFGRDESRALVTAIRFPEKQADHWLDEQLIYFHPRCDPDDKTSRYLVVEPDGKFEVRTFSTCAP